MALLSHADRTRVVVNDISPYLNNAKLIKLFLSRFETFNFKPHRVMIGKGGVPYLKKTGRYSLIGQSLKFYE